jgi:hypothetical protein
MVGNSEVIQKRRSGKFGLSVNSGTTLPDMQTSRSAYFRLARHAAAVGIWPIVNADMPTSVTDLKM